MAVVKADAYGHGLVPVAATVRAAGADWLGVALPSEALALRAAGDTGPLLCWLAVPGDPWGECIAAGIDVSAYDDRMLGEIVAAARASAVPARVHLKVDTGLSRGGAMPPWDGFFAQAKRAESEGVIEVVGLWSHFAYADEPKHPTVVSQIAAFESAVEVARRIGLRPTLRHLANSAATLALPHTHYDLVRPGIAVYGVSPGASVGTETELGLRPVMTLKSRFVTVKSLPVGSGVSYGHQYVTARDTTVGLIPLGYADGIPRAATNVGPVLAAGQVRTIAGRVCMDQVVVDLDSAPAQAGDEVVFFGDSAHGHPTATDWATRTGTIAYEIVTRIGPRVPRIAVGTKAHLPGAPDPTGAVPDDPAESASEEIRSEQQEEVPRG
jgi:alanine racemase